MSMTKIEHIEVGSGGQAEIDFTSIPAIYTDLLIVLSARTERAVSFESVRFYFNGSDSSLSSRYLEGEGSGSPVSGTLAYGFAGILNANSSTASTFSSTSIYIPNYAGSTNKSFSVDAVSEANATLAYQHISAGLWSSTSAINQVTLKSTVADLAQYSSATLYGIRKYDTAGSPKATGGIISFDSANNKWVHTFTASSTFTPTESLTADVLVVAGGGGGGINLASGGGAGGLLAFTGQSLSATAYTVTVGGGGSNGGGTGSDSQFAALTLVKGGGGGGSFASQNGANGGSGGGGNYNTGVGGTATSGQGNDGGDYVSEFSSSGGGGAGAAGTNGTGTLGVAGGVGTSAYSSWGAFGENVGGTYYLAGGGGGAGNASVTADNQGFGGYGGGGDAAPSNGNSGQLGENGTANTGGGGGGGGTGNGIGGTGGSGLVIVRYDA